METTGPTYEEVAGYLKYYANIFQCNRFDFWELVNEAWLRVRKQTNPKFWSNAIRWAMMGYMAGQRGQGKRLKPDTEIASIDSMIDEESTYQRIHSSSVDEQKPTDDTDHVAWLMDSHLLKDSYKEIIIEYYYGNMTLEQIGQKRGRTRAAVCHMLQTALRIIRNRKVA